MDEWRRILQARCTAAALPADLRELVQRELEEHFQDRADDLSASGLSAEAAAAALRGELPTTTAIEEVARSRRPPKTPAPPPPEAITGPRGVTHAIGLARRDISFALRTFARDRTFTAAAVATLALCLAANVVVFTIVNAVLLDAVGAPDPAALVYVGNLYPKAGVSSIGGANAGVPDYFDRRAAVPALAEQALLRVEGLSVGDEAAERLSGLRTTPSLFPMLRAQAALGRVFVEDDGTSGRTEKVILSDGLWRRRFAAAPSVIGRTLAIGGVPHDIVGVMPAGFRFYDDEVALWVPAAFTDDDRSDASRHSNNWTHVGRLAPGASVAQVQAQLDALNAANLERFPALKQVLVDAGFRSAATPLVDVLVADVRRPLLLLWGGVACVLLIGVVNLAALTLARATNRRAEIATRLALGAEPGRVRMQLVTEHAVLALLGGAGGFVLAWAALRLPGAGLALVPAGRTIGFDPVVWAYAGGLVVLVGLVLGLVAMRIVEPGRTATVLRDEGRSRAGSRTARRLRQGLVVGQVAVACMLLVAAGVLFTSFRRLLAVDTGFRTAVVTGAVSLPRAAYPTDPERLAFVDRLLTAVRVLPGVQGAGATTNIPFGTSRSDSVIWPEGWTPRPGESFVSPYQIRVTPGYFAAMGIAVVAGRDFDGADVDGKTPVVVVDERLAARFWPEQDPIGRYLLQPTTPEALTNPTPETVQRFRVVGVTRTIKQYALVTPADFIGTYYFPFAQSVPGSFTIAVDSGADAAAVAGDVRRAVAALDPRLPLFDVQVMHDRVRESLRARQATMTLAVVFGALALGLSAVGLYGVLAYLVAQRTREIGIRMALGGSAPAIAGLVLRESVTVVAVGLALGLAGAAVLGRALASEVYEVQPLDPSTMATAVVLLLVAALAATAAPARRALRVDPAVTLAAE